MTCDTRNAFRYASHSISAPVAPFSWTPGYRFSLASASWPPKGVTLSVVFNSKALPGIDVTMFYELYDGVPLMSKWMTVTSSNADDIIMNAVDVELFAASPRFGAYISHGSLHPGADEDGTDPLASAPPPTLLHAKTDQAHGAKCQWQDDYANSNDSSACAGCKDQGATEPF